MEVSQGVLRLYLKEFDKSFNTYLLVMKAAIKNNCDITMTL